MSEEKPLTPAQVASVFNVTVATVGAWADAGRLPYFRTPAGHRRYRRSDVEKFLDTCLGSNGDAA